MTPENLVDWTQLADLLGDPSEPEQRPMLAGMWRDMVKDLGREMDELSALETEAEMKANLHRLRGLVSMWGLSGLAQQMKTIEVGHSSLADWRREQVAIAAAALAVRKLVTGRYPWLESARVA